MIPVPELVEDEWSDPKKAAESTKNTNTKTGTTGFLTQAYDLTEVEIDKDSDREE